MKKWGMLVCLAAVALGVNISAIDVSKAAIYDPEPKYVGTDIYDPDPYFIYDPDPYFIFDPNPECSTNHNL